MAGLDSLGKRLSDSLATSGMSPASLAQRAGATEATISNWVNGNVQVEHVKAAVLLRICGVLGVLPEWLLFGQGSRSLSRVGEASASQPVKTETLKLALQLVDEALRNKDLTLPPPKRAEVTSLVYELLEEGMPEAKVLRFALAAA